MKPESSKRRRLLAARNFLSSATVANRRHSGAAAAEIIASQKLFTRPAVGERFKGCATIKAHGPSPCVDERSRSQIVAAEKKNIFYDFRSSSIFGRSSTRSFLSQGAFLSADCRLVCLHFFGGACVYIRVQQRNSTRNQLRRHLRSTNGGALDASRVRKKQKNISLNNRFCLHAILFDGRAIFFLFACTQSIDLRQLRCKQKAFAYAPILRLISCDRLMTTCLQFERAISSVVQTQSARARKSVAACIILKTENVGGSRSTMSNRR